jgi:hypothetical protein
MDNDMSFDLQAALPRLLPRAITWAEEREAEIIRNGVPLNPTGFAVARKFGVRLDLLIF